MVLRSEVPGYSGSNTFYLTLINYQNVTLKAVQPALSAGAIIGIVLSSVAVAVYAALGIVGCVFCAKKRRRGSRRAVSYEVRDAVQ